MLIESLCTVPQGMVSFRVTLFFVGWKLKCKLGRKKLFIWNYTNFKRSTLSQWVKPKYKHGALRSVSKKRLIEVCLPQSSFNLNDGKYIWESNYDKQRAVIFANKVFECGVPQRLCIDFRFIHLIKEAPVQLAARSYIQYQFLWSQSRYHTAVQEINSSKMLQHQSVFIVWLRLFDEQSESLLDETLFT